MTWSTGNIDLLSYYNIIIITTVMSVLLLCVVFEFVCVCLCLLRFPLILLKFLCNEMQTGHMLY